MVKLERDIQSCLQETYDLIIVGGGIYGIMLAFEAGRRNLHSLLLEKNDFISATSLNHLRTVHGGLRYLQSMDFYRFKESVGERKWFLKYFPQYVHVMPCLMPLYGKGMHRNTILRAGLLVNDMMSANRNKSVSRSRHLPGGKIYSPQQSQEIFPLVDTVGLTGSAHWCDATIEEYQRLMMDILKIASLSGAGSLNYVEAIALLKENNRVKGVRARDNETGKEIEFKAGVVINAAGPWSRDVASIFHQDHPPLFKRRLLLWNVLFDRQALSSHALGLTAVKGGGHTYFFHPWKDRLLVGTPETLVEKDEKETVVGGEAMDRFINDINVAVPGINIKRNDIQRVYTGILPANAEGRLAKRETIFDHSSAGGPKGLFSVSGVKFTTSRLVADKVLNKIFSRGHKCPYDKYMGKISDQISGWPVSFDYLWAPSSGEDIALLKKIMDEEAVVHLSDLILRRTSLGDHPERAMHLVKELKPLFGWDDRRWDQEVDQLKKQLKGGYSPRH